MASVRFRMGTLPEGFAPNNSICTVTSGFVLCTATFCVGDTEVLRLLATLGRIFWASSH